MSLRDHRQILRATVSLVCIQLCVLCGGRISSAAILTTGSTSPSIDVMGSFITGEMQVGVSAPGSLLVSNTSFLSSGAGKLGVQAGGNGSVSIEGMGEWDIIDILEIGFATSSSGTLNVIDATVSAENIVVGVQGTGELHLDDSGQLNSEAATLGQTGTVGTALGTATLTDGSAWINTGALVVGSGAQSSMTVASGSSVQTGALEIGRSTTATLSVQGGGVAPEMTTVTNNGLATLGTNAGSQGSVTVSGQGANWTSSGIIEVGRGGQGTLNIDADGSVTSTGGVIARSAAATGSVTITGPNAVWTVNGDLHVGGSTDGAGGTASLNLNPGGTTSVTGTLRNWSNGTIYLNGGTLSAGAIQHDGDSSKFSVTGGALTANSLTAPTGFTMFDGDVTVGSITAANASIGGGTLRVTTFNGSLTNNGATLAPGLSAGTTTINGDYSQNSPGVLRMELASASSYDKLIVTGNLAPNGSVLEVQLLGGYSPLAGAVFDILDWSSIDLFLGGFTLQLPTLAAGRVWNTSQLPTTGVLRVDSTGVLVGDYNGNGVVDVADYVMWRNNVGTTATLSNDPLGGTIGQAHYDQWRSHFGQTLGSAAGPGFQSATSLVPEPSTAMLVLIAAALFCRRFRG